MKWWHPIVANTGAWFIRSYFKLMRIECFGFDVEKQLMAERPDILYASWHRGFLYYAYHYRDTGGASMMSLSKDGELIALACEKLGIHGYRGSSTRGGSDALHGMVDFIKAGNIAGITPDGPKGPPYVSKPGIIQMAARTGAPLLGFAWDAYPCHEFNSWDRTIVPYPFSRLAAMLDTEPFYVPSGLTEHEYDKYRIEFDKRMNRMSYQVRYYVRNNLKNIDPHDIPVPDDYMDYLPRRVPKIGKTNY